MKKSDAAALIVLLIIVFAISGWFIHHSKHVAEYSNKTAYLHKGLPESFVIARHPVSSVSFCAIPGHRDLAPDSSLEYDFYIDNVDYGFRGGLLRVCIDKKSETVSDWSDDQIPSFNM